MESFDLVFSLTAVALLVGTAWFFGGRSDVKLGSVEEAAAAFAEDYWEAEVREVLVSADGRAALLALADGFGLVAALGDRLVARRLGRAEVRRVELAGSGLVVRLGDATLPRVAIAADRETARHWAARLEGPKAPLHQAPA